MDNTTDNPTTAHRAGYLFGSILRRYLGLERAMNLRFIGKGMNPVLCQWIVLILRFGLIALGLYLGFWVALAILAVWVAVGAAEVGLFSGCTSDDESDSGMRSGMSGFGYYMGEFRVDGARLDEED